MLKVFSNAGMIEWDGFGWGLHHIWYCLTLHHILHIGYCILHHVAWLITWHNNFTTPTMFQLLNIQLFQFRKIYDIV